MKHRTFKSKDKEVIFNALDNGTYSVQLITAETTACRIYKSHDHAEQRFEKYIKPLEK